MAFEELSFDQIAGAPKKASRKAGSSFEELGPEELFGSPAFDPEGSGYDYETARAAGLKPDETGHWPSRDPKTGMLLKGRKHETWHKTEAGEKALGNEIYAKDGRYYSREKYGPQTVTGMQVSSGLIPGAGVPLPMALPVFGMEREGYKLTDAGWIKDEPKLSVIPGVTNEEAQGRQVPELRADRGTGVEPPKAQRTIERLTEPFRWVEEPTADPEGFKDFVTRVVPESAAKTAGGLVRFMLYDLPKPFTDAVGKYAVGAWQQRASVLGQLRANEEFLRDLGEGVFGHVKGLSEFTGIPLGVYMATGELGEALGMARTPEQEREAFFSVWRTNPVGALLGVAPALKGVYGRVGAPLVADVGKRRAETAALKQEAVRTQNAELNKKAEAALAASREAAEKLAQEVSPEVQRMRQEFLETSKKLMEEKGLEQREPVEVADAKSKQGFAEAVKKFQLLEEPPVAEPAPTPKAEPAPTSSVKISQMEKPAEEVPAKQKKPRAKKAEPEAPVEPVAPEPTPAAEPPAPPPPFRDWLRKEHGIKSPKFIDETDLRLANPELAAKYDELIKTPETPETPKASVPRDAELAGAFEQPPEIAKARAEEYQRRAKHVSQDIELTTGKLINDVNLWRAGEEVAIDQVRSQLSELGARAEELRRLFPDARSFESWAETVRSAAEWARRSERPGGLRLVSGVDPLEAIDAVRSLLRSGVQGVTNAARQLVAEGKWTDPKALMAAYEANAAGAKELMAQKKWDAAGELVQLNQALREGAELITQTGSMKGVKLTSGIDPAAAVNELYKALRGIKKAGQQGKLKKALEQAERMFIDVAGNVKNELLRDYGDEGQRVAAKMALRKGASARAAAVHDQAMREVYGGLSHEMQDILDEVIFSRRVVQIDSYRRDIKHPGGLGGEQHLAFLTQLDKLKGMKPEQVADLQRRADAYFDVMREQLRQLKEERIISEETYENLLRFDYSRRQLIDEVDPRFKYGQGKGRVSVRESGVQSLARGTTLDALETDGQLLLAELVVRTQNRIMSNRLNRGMAEFVVNNPENRMGSVPKKDGGKGRQRGDVTVHYFEDGKKKNLYLRPSVAEEWLSYNHAIEFETANFFRIMSGSSLLRPMATGINPAFALRNLPRDLQHIWLTANYMQDGKWKSVYSPHLPVAAVQTAIDVATVAKDAFMRTGRWKDYIDQGGGMEFLVHQGRPLFRSRLGMRTKFQRLYDALGYLNETSEVLGRLALRERALKRGLDPEMATFTARDYMDFSQAGKTTRALDTAIPYLNARVQATRGIWRGAKRNPVDTGIKIAETMALSAGLYLLYRTQNKEVLDEMSPRDRANYWNIAPDGMSYTDEKGQKRNVYFRIPKDQGQQFFAFLAESLMAKQMGDPIDVDQIVETLEGLSPAPGIRQSLPPTIQAILGYATNKDFWRNEDIWKGPDVPSGEEYTQQTPELFKLAGEVGLSPERTKYMLERVFTSGTVYNQMVLSGFDEMLSEVPESQREMFWAEALKRGGAAGAFGVLDSFIGITHPMNKSGANIDEIVEQDNLRRWINTRSVDAKLQQWLVDKTATRSDVMREVKSVKDPAERERLLDRVKFAWQTRELTQRSFWMRLHGLTPEARAQAYQDYWTRATEEERAQLLRERKKVDSLFSDRFFRELKRLRREAP